VFFSRDDDEGAAAQPHRRGSALTYLVCDGDIDHIVGYVDATDLFQRVLRGQTLDLPQRGLVKGADRAGPADAVRGADQFREAHEDFAVIVNEYSLVVGVVTLNDLMSTVMGSLVAPHYEEQIVRRDDGSFLADGVTPIPDVERALEVEHWPTRASTTRWPAS
jgi:CBS domain containing-hemolysin-like protein